MPCEDTAGYIVLHAVHIGDRSLASVVNKPKSPKMQLNLQISANHPLPPSGNRGSYDRRIRAFLSGETHGEDVLGALYGDAADEPIPERLRAILNR
jgi:hypothetical protein